MIYCQQTENALRSENARLSKELGDAQLDLEDASKSRRDLQQQLALAAQKVAQSNADCAFMKVRHTIHREKLICLANELLIRRADSESLYPSTG